MQIIGVILILLVIGLFSWWFYFTQNKSSTVAQEKDGVQVFDIKVQGAYSPSVIEAKVGRPVKINFKREESSECSRYVNFPDFKIRQELKEGEITPVEFTPDKKGEFIFTCDMSMYRGKLIIE